MTRLGDILVSMAVLGDARAVGRSDAVSACLGELDVDVAYVRQGWVFRPGRWPRSRPLTAGMRLDELALVSETARMQMRYYAARERWFFARQLEYIPAQPQYLHLADMRYDTRSPAMIRGRKAHQWIVDDAQRLPPLREWSRTL